MLNITRIPPEECPKCTSTLIFKNAGGKIQCNGCGYGFAKKFKPTVIIANTKKTTILRKRENSL